MAKKERKTFHDRSYSTQGQKVSKDGEWILMSDGMRFKRTTLPSAATSNGALQEDVLDGLDEDGEPIAEEG